MRKYSAVAVVAVLSLTLLILGISYVAVRADRDSLQKTAVSQTQLIVELRQKMIPRDFSDLGELQQWVSDWRAWNIKSVGTPLSFWDCDNVTEAMQRGALKDGYLMSVALVDGNCTVYGVKVGDFANHVGNLTVAGGTFYFIEPQTGQIVRVIGRD